MLKYNNMNNRFKNIKKIGVISFLLWYGTAPSTNISHFSPIYNSVMLVVLHVLFDLSTMSDVLHVSGLAESDVYVPDYIIKEFCSYELHHHS
jgi:hypothetical protein